MEAEPGTLRLEGGRSIYSQQARGPWLPAAPLPTVWTLTLPLWVSWSHWRSRIRQLSWSGVRSPRYLLM